MNPHAAVLTHAAPAAPAPPVKAPAKRDVRHRVAVACLLSVPAVTFLVQRACPTCLPVWAPLAAFAGLLPAALYPFRSPRRACGDRVALDDVRVTSTRPDGRTETVEWNDLLEIGITTTDAGPAEDDFFWILLTTRGGCVVSGGAAGSGELLTRLQELPAFDDEAVLKAVGCTHDAHFVCWRRGASEAVV